MTSFVQVYGGSLVKVNFVSSPRFWRHGKIIGESSSHLFFEDKFEGVVSFPLSDIKNVIVEKKDDDVKRVDL